MSTFIQIIFDFPFSRKQTRYLQKDYVSMINIIVPQIENSIRNIAEADGVNIYKEVSKNEGYDLKTLDAVLRDGIIKNTLGENFAYYLQVFLTNPKGLNVRNSVCHGLFSYDDFNCMIADRLLHVMLCFRLLKN